MQTTEQYVSTQYKLTCPAHVHLQEQSSQYKGMQHQHCNLLLLMSQSKEYSLLMCTSPLLSSQKPVKMIIRIMYHGQIVASTVDHVSLPPYYSPHQYQSCYQAI